MFAEVEIQLFMVLITCNHFFSSSIIYEEREITEQVTDVSMTFAYLRKTNGLPKEKDDEKHQHFPRN